MTTMQTGAPLNLGINQDQAGIGQTSQHPNVVGDWTANARTLYQWFNTSAFALPAAGTFGNLGRDVIPGPGQNIRDASLQKYFNVTERLRFQFRAEFYNAPNHMSWWGVGTTLGSSNFGQITSGTDPRSLQLGLRMQF
jgi:hypothetical protein